MVRWYGVLPWNLETQDRHLARMHPRPAVGVVGLENCHRWTLSEIRIGWMEIFWHFWPAMIFWVLYPSPPRPLPQLPAMCFFPVMNPDRFWTKNNQPDKSFKKCSHWFPQLPRKDISERPVRFYLSSPPKWLFWREKADHGMLGGPSKNYIPRPRICQESIVLLARVHFWRCVHVLPSRAAGNSSNGRSILWHWSFLGRTIEVAESVCLIWGLQVFLLADILPLWNCHCSHSPRDSPFTTSAQHLPPEAAARSMIRISSVSSTCGRFPLLKLTFHCPSKCSPVAPLWPGCFHKINHCGL